MYGDEITDNIVAREPNGFLNMIEDIWHNLFTVQKLRICEKSIVKFDFVCYNNMRQINSTN